MRTTALLASLSCVLFLSACGGSAPPAAEPAAASSASAAPAASAEAPKEQASEAKPAEEKKPEAGSVEALANEVGRQPIDVVTLKDAVFMVVFEDSDPGKKAEQTCGKVADPKAKATCLGNERKKLDYDGVRFTKNKDGKWVWIVYRHRGNKLTMLHKVLFKFGPEEGKKVIILLEGKDTGSAPFGKPPGKLTYDVESDYRISTTDSKMGKMYFDAKVGIAGSDIPK